jgi:predicted transcriptional regulator
MTMDHLYTVGPDDDEKTVMARMKAGQARRVPVMEEDRVVGIIAQAELAVEPQSEAQEVERTVEKISVPAEPER